MVNVTQMSLVSPLPRTKTGGEFADWPAGKRASERDFSPRPLSGELAQSIGDNGSMLISPPTLLADAQSAPIAPASARQVDYLGPGFGAHSSGVRPKGFARAGGGGGKS